MKLLSLTVGGTTVPLPPDEQYINNQAGINGQGFITLIINLLLATAISIAFGYLMFGGFKVLKSRGDPKMLEEAKVTIRWALGGLIIVLLSFLIINTIFKFLRFPLL